MSIISKFRLVLCAATLCISACATNSNRFDPTIAPDTVPATTTTIFSDLPFGAARLEQAISDASDLPSDWTPQGPGSSSLTDILYPSTGIGFGNCGGPNRDELMNRFGIAAWAWSPIYATSNGALSSMGIFEFPTTSDASKFLEAIKNSGACGSETYSARELGDDEFQDDTPDEYRVNMIPGSENLTQWSINASYSTGQVLPSAKASGFTFLNTWGYSTRLSGQNLETKNIQVGAYEQYQNILLRFGIIGQCCTVGLTNSQAMGTDSTPSLESVDEFASKVRKDILASLQLPSP